MLLHVPPLAGERYSFAGTRRTSKRRGPRRVGSLPGNAVGVREPVARICVILRRQASTFFFRLVRRVITSSQNQMGGDLLASQPRAAIPRKLWQSLRGMAQRTHSKVTCLRASAVGSQQASTGGGQPTSSCLCLWRVQPATVTQPSKQTASQGGGTS